jgi:hypothetical protein
VCARPLALLRLTAPEVHPQSSGQPLLPLPLRISALPGALAHRPLSSRALRRFKGIPERFIPGPSQMCHSGTTEEWCQVRQDRKKKLLILSQNGNPSPA